MFAGMTVVDWIGVIGAVMIAGAYFSVSRGGLDAQAPGYNLLNLAGAGFILLSLCHRPNAGAIMIEVLWVAIALSALLRWYRKGQG